MTVEPRSKVIPRSQHHVAHLQARFIVPTKYEPPFLSYSQENVFPTTPNPLPPPPPPPRQPTDKYLHSL